MGLTIVDSSVLLGWLDASDAHHQVATDALDVAQAVGEIAIPAMAFSEVLVRPYAHGLQSGRRVEDLLTRLGMIVPISADIVRRAAQIGAKRQVKLPDALIIATGVELDAAQILTLDERWQTVDRRVRVIAHAAPGTPHRLHVTRHRLGHPSPQTPPGCSHPTVAIGGWAPLTEAVRPSVPPPPSVDAAPGFPLGLRPLPHGRAR